MNASFENPVITGHARLFTMGVRPLGAEPWLWPDANLEADLRLKDQLFATHHDQVFASTTDSEAAQAEALALITTHCLKAHPDLYRPEGASIHVGTERRIAIDEAQNPPLWRAAKLVQEDLIVMHPAPTGWVMGAGSLSFPSSWQLRDKMGLRLDHVHAHVPAFGPETRNAHVMARMFDNLRTDTPVLRWNYSLNGDPALYHPHPEASPRFSNGIWLRMERQTLRKLPETGAVLFTIRILHEAVTTPALACALIPQITALSPEQRDYKGLSDDFDDLMRRLRTMAAQA
jgi:dimethylamine monooxygenase subunit A